MNKFYSKTRPVAPKAGSKWAKSHPMMPISNRDVGPIMQPDAQRMWDPATSNGGRVTGRQPFEDIRTNPIASTSKPSRENRGKLGKGGFSGSL